MSALNRSTPRVYTNDNAKQLERLVLASMLWEDGFTIDGKSNADMIKDLIPKVSPNIVADLAMKARNEYKLRHMPLLLARELARVGGLQAAVLTEVIQRPDELGEFLSIYWKDGKVPISNQVKKGLAGAFNKFNEYQFAKWDKNSAAIKLRDVLFLSHAKPKNAAQEILFKAIAEGTLATPDTWETELSAGANKGATFTRLMSENKLGALAFLRNLRNMLGAGVSEIAIREYGARVDVSRVLPFRYIAAAKIVPQLQTMLEKMMLRTLAAMPKLPGRTVLVVDVSGSMQAQISAKSDLSRIDAAIALAMIAREVCEDVVIYATAGNDGRRIHATAKVPNYHGFELAEYFKSSQLRNAVGGGGIFFTQVIDYVTKVESGNRVDRVIVFTDELDTSSAGRNFNPENAATLAPKGRNYIANVGTSKNGLNNGKYVTITGFSEAMMNFIAASEKVI